MTLIKDQFNPQFGFGKLADGTDVEWCARGRNGSTSKYGGYPIDAEVKRVNENGESEILFSGAPYEIEAWLTERGFRTTLFNWDGI